jgi:conjugal transfer pilus assembly protein TraU
MPSRKNRLLAVLAVVAGLLAPAGAWALCANVPINPITDVCWHCVFPLSIGGITVMPGPYENHLPDLASFPVCTCPLPFPPWFRPGIPLSFWEPARIAETVTVPYCFPTLGLSLAPPTGLQTGSSKYAGHGREGGQRGNFGQAHYLIAAWWTILEIAVDIVCLEESGFDVAYLTEVDPTWGDSMLSLFKTPEALLFANPVTIHACIADAVSSAAGYSLSPLFWCTASAGTVYPFSGFKGDSDSLMAHEGLAARLQYMMARQWLACDTAITLCGCLHTPIWIRHNYRHHVMKPVRDVWCHPFGRTDLIWGWLKNPPMYGGNNFSWQQFRRRSCCAF